MVKILPKLRVKKLRDPSVTIKAPTRKPSNAADTDDDDHSAPLDGGNAKSSKRRKPKTSRQDKLATQKLAKERERTARAAAALDEKGNKLFERGDFNKAMVCYSKALKMKQLTFSSMLEDDAEFDENSTKKLSKSDSQVLVSMATSINNIGYLRQRSGEASASETMAAYQKALRIKRRILGNGSLSLGKTLNNIGSVHYLTREFEGALQAYSEALGIMIKNLGDQHPDIATVMSNIGDVHLANGNEQDSLESYRSALNIRYANFGKHDPRVVRLLEKIARIEIGDMMIPQDDQSMMDKDWEGLALTDLGMKPLQAEYQILNGELKADIEYLDELQKRVSKNIAEENVEIVKQIQDPPSLSSFDEGSDADINLLVSSSEEAEEAEDQTTISPGVCHKEALNHVNYRLEKIRSLKSAETMITAEEEDQIVRRTSISTTSSGEMYHNLYGQLLEEENDHVTVCSANSEEMFGRLYGRLETERTKSGMKPMNPNAANRLQTSSKLTGRSNRRVIVTS